MTTFILVAVIVALVAVVVKQQLTIRAITIHGAFGCLTRVGVDFAWAKRARATEFAVVFSDIDHMHAINEKLGYAAVDAMIKAWHDGVEIRRGDKERFGGQYMGGDEFAWFVPVADAEGFAARVKAAADTAGLSVSIGVARACSPKMDACVKAAADLVQSDKRGGVRGRIAIAL